jgi:hypothetical protein
LSAGFQESHGPHGHHCGTQSNDREDARAVGSPLRLEAN